MSRDCHGVHVRTVILDDVVAVMISVSEAMPARVGIMSLTEDRSSTSLTPEEARALGQVLAVRDPGLSRELIQAADDLAESGGHAAGALSDAQLDGAACIRCGAAEGPMVPAGVGGRGQLFECSHHRQAGGEA